MREKHTMFFPKHKFRKFKFKFWNVLEFGKLITGVRSPTLFPSRSKPKHPICTTHVAAVLEFKYKYLLDFIIFIIYISIYYIYIYIRKRDEEALVTYSPVSCSR